MKDSRPLRPRRAEDTETSQIVRSYAFGLVGMVLLLTYGTVGFHTIEHWSWWDSLYMVIISVTTVGYGEVHPLSTPGQFFAVTVILGGAGVGSYVLLTLTRTFIEGIIEGSLSRALARRRMERELPKLNHHIVVCGFGRLGHEICVGLASEWRAVVAIDTEAEAVEQARDEGFHCIRGDAADETVLKAAGIERASAIAIASSSDAINTYITLTARELNPKLRIIARANEEAAVKRLKAAGADQVVAPTRIGGQRIAHMLVRPGVVDFLDFARLGDFPDLFIEEVIMQGGAELEDRSLLDGQYNAKWRVLVLAVRKADGTRSFRPDPHLPIQAGDALILAGHRTDLDALETAMTGDGG